MSELPSWVTLVTRGGVEIGGAGLALAPGFIDVHSHDDFAVLLTPEMDFKVMQGVTIDVVGNCGNRQSGSPRERECCPQKENLSVVPLTMGSRATKNSEVRNSGLRRRRASRTQARTLFTWPRPLGAASVKGCCLLTNRLLEDFARMLCYLVR
jgi:hypothetical protein